MNQKRKAHLAWQRNIARIMKTEVRTLLKEEKKNIRINRTILGAGLGPIADERAKEHIKTGGFKCKVLNEYLQKSDKRLFQNYWSNDWYHDFYSYDTY